MTPEFAALVGFDEELRATLAAEGRSTVTFEIEDLGETVKLSVLHHDFDADSTMVTMISEGWPPLIASLKTLLETGDVLALPG